MSDTSCPHCGKDAIRTGSTWFCEPCRWHFDADYMVGYHSRDSHIAAVEAKLKTAESMMSTHLVQIQTERDTMSQNDAQMSAKEQIRLECLKLAVALYCAPREDLSRTPENVVAAATQMVAMVEQRG